MSRAENLFRQACALSYPRPRGGAPAIWRELAERHRSRNLYLRNGGAEMDLGRYNAARLAFGPALAIEPRCAIAHAFLGQMACVRHDYAEAVQHFEGSVAMAVADDHAGDATRAEQALRRAIQRRPAEA